MRKILVVVFFISFLFASNTLPTDHWAYKSIDKFRVGGFFHHYGVGVNTLSRRDVAQELLLIEKEMAAYPSLKMEYDLLCIEFAIYF